MAWHHFVAYLVTALFSGSDHRRRTAVAPKNCRTAHKCARVGGAAMFVSINHLVPLNATSLQVAAPVVSGIGFLGAGVIMRGGLSIRGLNDGHPLVLDGGGLTLWTRLRQGGSDRCSRSPGSKCSVPSARAKNRPASKSASDVETRYLLRLVCRSDDEGKARVLLMHLLHALPFTLHALHSEDLKERIERAVAETRKQRESPSGRIRVIIPRTATQMVILPKLAQFARTYPEIALEGHLFQ
jgi:hypothetical protein